MADAVVIGAGPNGLVAANVLADRGWDVEVLEEASEPGGAVKSGELVEPDFVSDLFSAFYPLAAASPHIQRLDLERWGLRWRRSRVAVAHPGRDGGCPLVSSDLDETAASLDAFHSGDGDGWRELFRLWERVRGGALDAFFSPFPPVRAGLRVARAVGRRELLPFVRFATLPVRRLGEETFGGAGGARLLAGNALHADVSPETPLGGVVGWVLCSLAQQYGFPVVEGGAGNLTGALVRRLEAAGGRVTCGARATRIELAAGRAVAVHAGERSIAARRAVLADVGAPQLYLELLGHEELPDGLLRAVRRFQYDQGTVKVDWTLDGPIPWTAAGAREAGTVHVADGVDSLTKGAAEIARGLIPATPYLVMGQYAAVDPSRAPAGKETAWAYTHVPQEIAGDAGGELTGRFDEHEVGAMADRIEAEVEALAPGFRSSIRARHVFTPATLERANRNLVGGALNGGTAQLHQQLVFRPLPGLARAETPIEGLFLASASAHPGGGVHGTPGANAARAAIAASAGRRRAAARLGRALLP